MEFILAKAVHLDEMCTITAQAKAQLKALGLDQWQKGYPSREVWETDIASGNAWVAIENNTVLGAFAFQTTPDVSYCKIDGAWLTDTPYASMHRVCVADHSKGKGVAGQMFLFGTQMAKQMGFHSIRIDTHPGNFPMQRALEKAGFLPCGSIFLKGGCEDGDLRIAFEKLLD
ncbi:MAG: GNAT family N-acetyltransferase [Oscillospiraceae bacterium]|nr:GNAT family N-acetyltransferase [Oscillospiraceae bacterium]